MKKWSKTIISLCCALLMAFTFTIPSIAEEKSNEAYTNWMSSIPDKTKLSDISIPGTHDSATQYCTLGYFTSCQDTSMAEQMEDGYRYLDVRLMLNDNLDGFILNHGGYKARKSIWPWSDKITFDDLVNDTYKFLDANPTETIILALKIEKSDNDVATCEQLVLDTINKNPDKWYTKNEIPTLGDVRGKIVLATRYQDALGVGDERSGLHFYWEEQNNKEPTEVPYTQTIMNSKNESLWVQDRFKYTLANKSSAFEEGLDNCLADDESFFINFLSLSGQSLLPHPKGNANELNPLFMKKTLNKGTCYGIIVVDRANKAMASKIFETNFQ